ncbi:MAG: DUF2141 domain-containing protein [Bacteroidota bacterium]
MKTLTIFFAIVFSTFLAYGQETETVTVTVTIENVLNDQGTVLAALHTEETFMKGAGIINLTEPAKEGELTFIFENVPPGTYAIMTMHDANDNKRMDYQVNGMPKESYGVSGNDMSMGPPTFDGAKFDVAGENLEINMRF